MKRPNQLPKLFPVLEEECVDDYVPLNDDVITMMDYQNDSLGLSADSDSDGDYFETLADGTIRLKKGKKKIDINKLSDDDLRKLGIDPRNMSKQEIARILKVSFPISWDEICRKWLQHRHI